MKFVTSRDPSPEMVQWLSSPIVAIESWRNAVAGAELSAVQLSGKVPGGTLFTAIHEDRSFSTGRIEGDISLLGMLSDVNVTLGLGLHYPAQTLHWLQEVETGTSCVWLAGDAYDAIYRPGSIYFMASLAQDRLEELAADLDLVLDAKQLGQTRISGRLLDTADLALLRRLYKRLHDGEWSGALTPAYIGELALDMLIEHYARRPRYTGSVNDREGFARIVARARAYIMEHLDAPISIADISRAAVTSRRTLYRAFEELLGETPQSYVRNLRLNRIRRDLTSSSVQAGATVTEIATRWGVHEFGRLAGDYRRLFGELPSDTLKKSGTLRIANVPWKSDKAE